MHDLAGGRGRAARMGRSIEDLPVRRLQGDCER